MLLFLVDLIQGIATVLHVEPAVREKAQKAKLRGDLVPAKRLQAQQTAKAIIAVAAAGLVTGLLLLLFYLFSIVSSTPFSLGF